MFKFIKIFAFTFGNLADAITQSDPYKLWNNKAISCQGNTTSAIKVTTFYNEKAFFVYFKLF